MIILNRLIPAVNFVYVTTESECLAFVNAYAAFLGNTYFLESSFKSKANYFLIIRANRPSANKYFDKATIQCVRQYGYTLQVSESLASLMLNFLRIATSLEIKWLRLLLQCSVNIWQPRKSLYYLSKLQSFNFFYFGDCLGRFSHDYEFWRSTNEDKILGNSDKDNLVTAPNHHFFFFCYSLIDAEKVASLLKKNGCTIYSSSIALRNIQSYCDSLLASNSTKLASSLYFFDEYVAKACSVAILPLTSFAAQSRCSILSEVNLYCEQINRLFPCPENLLKSDLTPDVLFIKPHPRSINYCDAISLALANKCSHLNVKQLSCGFPLEVLIALLQKKHTRVLLLSTSNGSNIAAHLFKDKIASIELFDVDLIKRYLGEKFQDARLKQQLVKLILQS